MFTHNYNDPEGLNPDRNPIDPNRGHRSMKNGGNPEKHEDPRAGDKNNSGDKGRKGLGRKGYKKTCRPQDRDQPKKFAPETNSASPPGWLLSLGRLAARAAIAIGPYLPNITRTGRSVNNNDLYSIMGGAGALYALPAEGGAATAGELFAAGLEAAGSAL